MYQNTTVTFCKLCFQTILKFWKLLFCNPLCQEPEPETTCLCSDFGSGQKGQLQIRNPGINKGTAKGGSASAITRTILRYRYTPSADLTTDSAVMAPPEGCEFGSTVVALDRSVVRHPVLPTLGKEPTQGFGYYRYSTACANRAKNQDPKPTPLLNMVTVTVQSRSAENETYIINSGILMRHRSKHINHASFR